MQDIISQLKDKWFILAFITAMILWYGNTNYRLNTVEAKIIEQQTALEQIAGMKTDIEVIKTNVQFIKEQI